MVATYNADGTLGWAKRAGGSDYDQGSGIAALDDGAPLSGGFIEDEALWVFASEMLLGPSAQCNADSGAYYAQRCERETKPSRS